MPNTFSTIVMKSSPAVSDGIVYIGSMDGNMYALDANSGNVVWKTETLGPIENSPSVSNGCCILYFPRTDHWYALQT